MQLILSTLFSANTAAGTIRVFTLLLYGAMAAVINVTCGVNNIGLEGILLSSALVAVIASWLTQSWFLGMLITIVWSVALSLLFGYLVMTLDAHPTLVGLALNTFAAGGTVFVLSAITGTKGSSISLASKVAPKFSIPVLCDIPYLGVLFTDYSIFTYLAMVMIVVLIIVMKRAPIGLKIRAVGLNQNAAESVGISVKKVRYIAFAMSGFILGLGGSYITMGYFQSFTRDMTAGIGFMCIAACNMGAATPVGAFFSSLLFAFAKVFSNVMQSLQMSVDLINGFPYMITIIALVVIGIVNRAKEKKAHR